MTYGDSDILFQVRDGIDGHVTTMLEAIELKRDLTAGLKIA